MKRWIPAIIITGVIITVTAAWLREEKSPVAGEAWISTPTPVAAQQDLAEPETDSPAPATAMAPSKVKAPSSPEADQKEIPRPAAWSEKTLAGTTWKTEGFDFSFGKDGTWHMAGRAASKWRVEGDRIKLFNDKGEVHYIEIEGDMLTFNGKPVGHPVARE